MSKQLATIKVDVPIDVSIETLTANNEDPQALRKIYRDLEFTSLYREIQGENNTKREWPKKELAQLNMKCIAILGTFHGKNAGTFQLDAFAASDGEGIFLSQSENDFFAIVTRAEEIITHNLKPLLIVAGNRQQSEIGNRKSGITDLSTPDPSATSPEPPPREDRDRPRPQTPPFLISSILCLLPT